MIEVVSGKGQNQRTSFWNDDQLDDAIGAAQARAEREDDNVRVVRDGKPILTVPSNWRDDAERWI